MDLITSARAKYSLNNLTTTAEEDTTLAALVAACSRAIRTYCRRQFDSQQFDELYNGNGQLHLVLRQYPLLAVARVAHDPAAVLRITNTAAANQRATVAVTATGLTLLRVASGVAASDSITWSAQVTLEAVASAVSALGNGWSAAVVDASFNDFASADLRALQGAFNAKDVQAELRLHVQELTGYEVDAEAGILLRSRDADGPCWTGGVNFWRVVYTAGYASVPEDVQEACAQWVAALFWQTKRDPGLRSESIPSVVARAPFADMPSAVRSLLAPYRAFPLRRS